MENTKGSLLTRIMFAVSKEPFDFDIFSSLFSFSLLDLYIYHPLSDAYYTTFDT